MARRIAPQPSDAGPGFRSAAVARMAQMPVATLRIWEQRYGAVQPATAPSGHRRYSPADVQRVLLLRQLTGLGHAIGSIAALDTAALQALATPGPMEAAPAAARPARSAGRGGPAVAPPVAARPLRVVVVGPALALRLQRMAGVPGAARPLQLRAVFETLAEAAAHPQPADLLLWHAPVLQPDSADALGPARAACGARRAAVVTRFAGAAAVRALAALDVPVLQEPPGDDALAAWLATLAPVAARRRSAGDGAAGAPSRRRPAVGAAAPRRYDDATLTALVGRLPSLACECPRHVAELLMQLAAFESYSAGCRDRSPADAALHAELHALAGTARALFESALERVAQHEGVALR
jgi:hypothetical protein